MAIEPRVCRNKCPECLNGRYNLCSKVEHIGSGAHGGAFAAYMIVRKSTSVIFLSTPLLKPER